MSLVKTRWTAAQLRLLLNFFPPMSLGAGIRVDEIAPDFRYARTSLPLRFYNRNYVGSHFGGSLYSMTDPMYMLMLLNILGPQFIVWDKAARIDYKKPGRGTVTAEFHLPETLIESLQDMQPDEKRIVDLNVDVKDQEGDVVAHVLKTEYIRRKPLSSSTSASASPGSFFLPTTPSKRFYSTPASSHCHYNSHGPISGIVCMGPPLADRLLRVSSLANTDISAASMDDIVHCSAMTKV